MSVPGLTPAESTAYEATLRTHCRVRVQVQMRTLSHVLVSALDQTSIDGQINIVGGDTNGITRTLQVSLFDPEHALQFDASNPADGMGGMDRLLFVRTSVFVPSLDRWVSAPAGVFRPSKVARDGAQLTIEGDSKECLSMMKISPYTIPAKKNVVDAVHDILARHGETRFRFPKGIRNTLPDPVKIGGTDDARVPWKMAWKLARSIGYQLYYDLDGFAVLRKYPGAPNWTLYASGENANMLSPLTTSVDMSSIRNRVVVTGKTKAHGKTKAKNIPVIEIAPAANALSPWKLSVNGNPWESSEFYDTPNLHTRAKVKEFAVARLNDLLTEAIEVQVTTLPYWHALPMDLIHAKTEDGGTISWRMRDASIPLGDDENGMTMGYTRRVRGPRAGRMRR